MAFTLQLVRGPDAGREYELVEDEIVIGRDPKYRIVIGHGAVSRRHARLVFDDNRYFIEDLRSRNGTYVNGKRLADRVQLRNNDRIDICHTGFVFRSSPPRVSESDEEEPSSSVLLSADADSTRTMIQVHAEEKLHAILEISDALGRVLDLKRVLDTMLEHLFEIFPQADHGLILLRQEDRLIPGADKHRREKPESIRYSRTLVEKVMSEHRAILIEDADRDDRAGVTGSVKGLRIRSVVCAPLLSQDGEAMGIVQLDTAQKRGKFDSDDLHLLASVAKQAAISLEYAQLHREKMKHARLERELDIARQVQYSLLPEAVPQVAGYSFWAHYRAAGQVGGDFYDFLRLPNGRQVVLLGDVAGKGIPAALKMVKVATLCKVTLLSHPDDIEEAANVLNRAVCDAARETELVSLVLCVIDPATHAVTVANAGHMPPMFRRKNGCIDEEIGERAGGFMLGVDREYAYKTASTHLDVGESVVLYSDGISDAMDPEGRRYSIERVRKQLMHPQQRTAAEIGQELLDDVERHVASGNQHDDMTLTVFRRDFE
jgi:serine phosphatase RsbU (regulator of sigma subunit)/pSer/pThr/pTyr-binding forkhead associated (FHA) protein